MSVRATVKGIQDIMRQDVGVDGDAQRISQLCWMFFLKILDDQDQEFELMQRGYTSPLPDGLRWGTWAADPEGMTGDTLLDFINEELFPSLKELPTVRANRNRRRVVRSVFEDAYNYMKSGYLLRQVVNKINEVDFNNLAERQHFGDVYEQLLIHVAKVLSLSQVVEIDLVDLVDHLPEQVSRLHVVVGVLEHTPHNATTLLVCSDDREFLQARKQLVVDEVEQSVSGHPLGVCSPRPPAQVHWQRRGVAALHQLELLILVIKDLEKEHPAQLRNPLRVAVDAHVLPHDVLDPFDRRSDAHVVGALLMCYALS